MRGQGSVLFGSRGDVRVYRGHGEHGLRQADLPQSQSRLSYFLSGREFFTYIFGLYSFGGSFVPKRWTAGTVTDYR